MKDDLILLELQKISGLLAEQLASNKFLERRLQEMVTSSFGLRALFALQKKSLLASGDESVFSFQYEGLNFAFSLPKAHIDFIQQRILLDETFYELKLLELVRLRNYEGAEILDIGANIGNHSVYFSKLFKAGRVVSFEPQLSVRETLLKNVGLNLASNIVVLPYALGAVCGSANPSHHSSQNSGSVSFRFDEQGNVDLRTLDSLGFSPNLLKIDVEGYELEVLTGGAKTIVACKPDIWIECFAKSFEAVNAYLVELGYQISERLPSHNYLYTFGGRP